MVNEHTAKEVSIYTAKSLSLQRMVLGKLDSYIQKNETEPFAYIEKPAQNNSKINSKWIKDLSVRPETTKIIGQHGQ